MTAKQPAVLPDDAEWRAILQQYSLRATDPARSLSTVQSETRTLRAVISQLELRPSMTLLEVEAQLEELQAGAGTVKRYRTAVRGLWRWRSPSDLPTHDLRPQRQPVLLQQLDPRWSSPIRDFRLAQQAANYEPATVERRVRHMQRLAQEFDVSPWSVTWELYRGALDSLPVAKSTWLAYRGSARLFWRWAVKTNRALDDPTAEPSLRAELLRASAAWEEQLAGYRRAMRASGRLESTVKVRLSQLRAIARRLGDARPFSQTTDDLLDVLAGFKWSSEMRKAHVSALRSFYGWAKRAGRMKRNPAKHLPAVTVRIKVVHPATAEDYREALAKGTADDRLALRLAAEAGLRCAEVATATGRALRGSDGDWWLTVQGKGDKQREVPLSDAVAHLLRGRGPWAFPGQDDGHISPGALGRRLNRLLPDGVTLHKLRHRFADAAYADSHDLLAVQALLGHASPTTTRRYVRSNLSDLRRAVDGVRAVTPGA